MFEAKRPVYFNASYRGKYFKHNQNDPIAKELGAKNTFCVSTDKAANPVNMMGASKRIMEMFLMRESESINISTARFANVAFSDGSLSWFQPKN